MPSSSEDKEYYEALNSIPLIKGILYVLGEFATYLPYVFIGLLVTVNFMCWIYFLLYFWCLIIIKMWILRWKLVRIMRKMK